MCMLWNEWWSIHYINEYHKATWSVAKSLAATRHIRSPVTWSHSKLLHFLSKMFIKYSCKMYSHFNFWAHIQFQRNRLDFNGKTRRLKFNKAIFYGKLYVSLVEFTLHNQFLNFKPKHGHFRQRFLWNIFELPSSPNVSSIMDLKNS